MLRRFWWWLRGVLGFERGVYRFYCTTLNGKPLYFCRHDKTWMAHIEGGWYLSAPTETDPTWTIDWRPEEPLP